ncbi:hypothetical protein ACTA71_007998 [Dictyostelium dimigraforme]
MAFTKSNITCTIDTGQGYKQLNYQNNIVESKNNNNNDNNNNNNLATSFTTTAKAVYETLLSITYFTTIKRYSFNNNGSPDYSNLESTGVVKRLKKIPEISPRSRD